MTKEHSVCRTPIHVSKVIITRQNQDTRSWFADRVVEVRKEYSLTIDQAEADALDAIIAGCTSFDMIVTGQTNYHPADTNQNGKIDAAEVLAVVALYFQGLGN